METNACKTVKKKLYCRLDDVAVPEVMTKECDCEECLEIGEETFCFDTVAVPEIHIGTCKNKKK